MLDAPADLGQPHQIRSRMPAGNVESQQSMGSGWPGGHSDSSQHSGRLPSAARGMLRLAGRTRGARNRDRMLAVGLPGDFLDPCRQTTDRPAERPAAITRLFRSCGGAG